MGVKCVCVGVCEWALSVCMNVNININGQYQWSQVQPGKLEHDF